MLTDSELIEIKNTNYLCLTAQIRDFLAYCEKTGRILRLVTRAETRLSAPVQALADAEKIQIDHLSRLATPEGVKMVANAIAQGMGFDCSNELVVAALSGKLRWTSEERLV